MEFLFEIGIFFVQSIIVVAVVLLIVAGLSAISQRYKSGLDGQIEVRRLNERYEAYRDAIRSLTESDDERKVREKTEKKQAKAEHKAAKKRATHETANAPKPRLFVLRFDGDMQASQADALREEISAVLLDSRPTDEILVCLESPGGLVHGYGLAASQLSRIRSAGIPLTVAVDKVAASGGYMMACVADRIIAAPFAVIGSIGVLAQLPNFHRLLKKHDIDFEQLTAGEYKRTLTLFGENTDEGRKKFTEDLEDTHELFKGFVKDNRSVVNIEQVATGEIWYGQRALDVNLIDDIQTSDDYIQRRLDDADILEVRFVVKKSWQEKLGVAAEVAVNRSLNRLLQLGTTHHLP